MDSTQRGMTWIRNAALLRDAALNFKQSCPLVSDNLPYQPPPYQGARSSALEVKEGRRTGSYNRILGSKENMSSLQSSEDQSVHKLSLQRIQLKSQEQLQFRPELWKQQVLERQDLEAKLFKDIEELETKIHQAKVTNQRNSARIQILKAEKLQRESDDKDIESPETINSIRHSHSDSSQQTSLEPLNPQTSMLSKDESRPSKGYNYPFYIRSKRSNDL